MKATISHGALRAHRAGLVTSGLRGLCTSAPVFAVGLATWRPELFLLIAVAGIVMLVSGWSTVRSIRELRQPLLEVYAIDPERSILTRTIGDEEVHAIARARVKQIMRFPGMISVYDGRRQMLIPSDAVGFDALVEELGRWAPIADREEALELAGRSLSGGTLVKAGVLMLALVYFVWATGAWIGISIGVAAGLALSEIASRVLIARSLEA